MPMTQVMRGHGRGQGTPRRQNEVTYYEFGDSRTKRLGRYIPVGYITFNSRQRSLIFGDAKWTHVFIDAKKQRIGVLPTKRRDDNSYSLTRNKATGVTSLYVKRVLTEAGIRLKSRTKMRFGFSRKEKMFVITIPRSAVLPVISQGIEWAE